MNNDFGEDEYGCLGANPKAWDFLAANLKNSESFTFSYCAGLATAYIITIAKANKVVGVSLPWGGQINGMHLVALRKHGSEFFRLVGSDQILAPSYLMEKLNIGTGDVGVISQLLNELRERCK